MRALLRPRYWGGHLLMLVCLAIAVGLGLWQYGAWTAHREAEARDLSGAKAVPLEQLMSGDDPFPGEALGQPVSFAGRWLESDTVYVADRRLEDATGFWVVTPVLVRGTGSAMPVVRGWSATTDAPPLTGTATVTGWLQASEGSGKPDVDPEDDVLPEMRIASLVDRIGGDLYGAFVVTRGTEEPGLVQVTPASIPAVSGFTALRNLLYAIEWWIFAGFAVFVWWRWCRDELNPEQAAAPASVGSGT